MSYLSYTQEFTGPDQVILRTPQRYMPLVEFLEQTSRQPSEMTMAERELLASYVSGINASTFCVGIHNGVASAYGPCGMDSKAPEVPIKNDRLGEKFAPVKALVNRLLKSPEAYGQTDVDAVLAAGWSEQTVEDIIGLAASVTVYNIMSVGFGFKSAPADYFLGLGEAVKENGYETLFRSMLDAAE